MLIVEMFVMMGELSVPEFRLIVEMSLLVMTERIAPSRR